MNFLPMLRAIKRIEEETTSDDVLKIYFQIFTSLDSMKRMKKKAEKHFNQDSFRHVGDDFIEHFHFSRLFLCP